MRTNCKYDIIILGAGIAGLYAALHIPKEKNALILCKDIPWECNTFYAQGGVAAAVDEEDVALHIADTLNAGAGLCNEEAVRVMVEESLDIIPDLIRRGFDFDCDEKGNLLYTKEAAHSRSRILHAGGDATGRYLHQFLMQKNPHPLVYNVRVFDLLRSGDTVYGVRALINEEIKELYADAIVIASGGVGSLYAYHTNSRTISSDLHGICLERGIRLDMMEMMQFHPTVYVDNPWARKQLLTEALRGEGAEVVDEEGRRFLFDYDERGELAPRDIVSRAIFDYQKRKGSKVYLKMDMFDEEFFAHRFPNIKKSLASVGFKLPKDWVPISPAFHYAIGGIVCDLDGVVPGLENLYVIGEAASTGVHGANRLASNSLLEGLVFGRRAALHLIDKGFRWSHKPPFAEFKGNLVEKDDTILKQRLRRTMWQEVGIVRTRSGLERALDFVDDVQHLTIGRLLGLRLKTARKIIESALQRHESVGAHYIINE
ncbi:FAD-dependent oxidoreductase [Hydrogenimonas sp.]|uniref:L-aspartate oxidase n=1 Tax=Hydrogenimonas sp. TaxID=2231112 RepID=UPI002638F9E5|nr:FAD-dependent oxidoreductase [Hydrogenimonas sp.]